MRYLKPEFPIIKRILFIFFMIMATLCILEIVLRLSGDIYLCLKYSSKTVHVDLDEFNILCLGDSFTQGFGAPDGWSYSEQLEKLLSKIPGNKKKFNVYKKFYINSSTILKYLTKDIEMYKPNLIIIMTGCNDRWSLENFTDFVLINSNFLTRVNVWLSSFNVYKLAKISFLNLKNLRNRIIYKFNKQVLDVDFEISSNNRLINFKNPIAAKYYKEGEHFFLTDNLKEAFKKFKSAEQLEPDCSMIHFRLACLYIQAFHNYELGRKHALFALSYGDSSIVGHIFMIMQCGFIDKDRNILRTIIADMKNIINNAYRGKDRAKALRYLKVLFSFEENNKEIGKILDYNLNEMINIIKRHKIKIILMHYPINTPWTREVVKNKAYLLKIPLIDNYAIFQEKLKEFKKEDLFARDGHCNANGYGIIAENIYKIIYDVIGKEAAN